MRKISYTLIHKYTIKYTAQKIKGTLLNVGKKKDVGYL